MSENIFRGKGFQEFKVIRRVSESDIIASFYLQHVENSPLPSFKPGQFLTFGFEHPETKEALIRTYSISSGPDCKDSYRISVKREPAPVAEPELLPGIASNYLHEHVSEGDSLWVKMPTGQFFLDEKSDRPVVLLSGGVGITPMVSMAHALSNKSDREVWFIHACEDGSVHAFDQEIKGLVSPSFHYQVCYREPRSSDEIGIDFHAKGFVTREVLQSLLPINDYEFYLCGPPAFMQAEYELLASLGVSEERISYEFFGPATVLKSKQNEVIEPVTELPEGSSSKPVDGEQAEAGGTPQVTFSKSNIVVPWDPEYSNLLDFAEAHQLTPEFSCRAGICNSCMCGLLEGSVSYLDEPLSDPDVGSALICCSVPSTDIVLEL